MNVNLTKWEEEVYKEFCNEVQNRLPFVSSKVTDYGYIKDGKVLNTEISFKINRDRIGEEH